MIRSKFNRFVFPYNLSKIRDFLFPLIFCTIYTLWSKVKQSCIGIHYPIYQNPKAYTGCKMVPKWAARMQVRVGSAGGRHALEATEETVWTGGGGKFGLKADGEAVQDGGSSMSRGWYGRLVLQAAMRGKSQGVTEAERPARAVTGQGEGHGELCM